MCNSMSLPCRSPGQVMKLEHKLIKKSFFICQIAFTDLLKMSKMSRTEMRDKVGRSLCRGVGISVLCWELPGKVWEPELQGRSVSATPVQYKIS